MRLKKMLSAVFSAKLEWTQVKHPTLWHIFNDSHKVVPAAQSTFTLELSTTGRISTARTGGGA